MGRDATGRSVAELAGSGLVALVDDPADPRLDDVRDLGDQRFRRRHEGDELFVAEGFVAIDRAIDSGHELRTVVLLPSRVARFGRHLDWCQRQGVDVVVVERELLHQVVGFDLHRGVVAVARRRPVPSVRDLVPATAGDLAVLEGLNDPENVGVIARAGRALGLDGVLLDPTSTDPYARRSVRVSMGEILHLPIARAVEWPNDLAVLSSAGVEVWALTPDHDADDLWSLTEGRGPESRVALCLGAEGHGLTDDVFAVADRRVRIPISDAVDSLNVGHAAAVAFAALGRSRATPT